MLQLLFALRQQFLLFQKLLRELDCLLKQRQFTPLSPQSFSFFFNLHVDLSCSLGVGVDLGLLGRRPIHLNQLNWFGLGRRRLQ